MGAFNNLEGLEWIILFILVGIVLAPWVHRTANAPKSFGSIMFQSFHTLFYLLIGFGIYHWYYQSTVNYAQVTVMEATSDNTDNDDDDTHNYGQDHAGAPRNMHALTIGSATYTAQWIIIIVSFGLFKLADALWTEYHREDEKSLVSPQVMYWMTAVAAILLHIVATIIFFVAHANLAGGLYIGAAVVYIGALLYYFVIPMGSGDDRKALYLQGKFAYARLVAALGKRQL